MKKNIWQEILKNLLKKKKTCLRKKNSVFLKKKEQSTYVGRNNIDYKENKII